MNQDELKLMAAAAAIEYLDYDMVLGVGTGSTANCFIDLLAEKKHMLEATVASSEATAERLRSYNIPVVELNQTNGLSLYVDGADESDEHLNLIKGGGGALTREKIIAGASEKFVCIADQSKLVKVLGAFPLPVEVIPMAQSHVGRVLAKMGGKPKLRDGFTTDNGNIIIDVVGLDLTDPLGFEHKINNIAGVVTVGLFSERPADILLLAGQDGIQKLTR